jgi:hypothetical protein
MLDRRLPGIHLATQIGISTQVTMQHFFPPSRHTLSIICYLDRFCAASRTEIGRLPSSDDPSRVEPLNASSTREIDRRSSISYIPPVPTMDFLCGRFELNLP